MRPALLSTVAASLVGTVRVFFSTSRGRCIAVNRREYVRKYEPREECEEIVSTLMRHGARTDIPGYDGHPPLEQAWLLGLEDEALRWYREGVERGADDAQFNLGLMYARGEGVARDHAEESWTPGAGQGS